MALNNIKYFRNFKGLSYRIPSLLPDQTYATDLRNVTLTEQFAISKRRGYQYKVPKSVGGNGVVTYYNTEIGAGTDAQQRLIADENLYEIIDLPITYTYTGLGLNSDVKIILKDDGIFYCQLIEQSIPPVFPSTIPTSVTNEIALGTGKEVSFFSIEDLDNAVDSSGWPFELVIDDASGTIDLDDYPAAFITKSSLLSISPLSYQVATLIDTPGAYVPFSGHWAEKANTDWELQSSVQIHNCVYFSNKYDGLNKYDGNKVYKAGLPSAGGDYSDSTNVLISSDEAPATTDKWRFRAIYRYTDAQGNVTQSTPTQELIVPSETSTPEVQIDISNIEAQGYDTEDYGTSDRGLFIELYRTVENGTVFRLVDTKEVGDAASSIITFSPSDTTGAGMPDATLLLQLEYALPIPTQFPTEPPKCQYIDVWRNNIVMTGNSDNINALYVADTLGIEGFPNANSLDISSRRGGPNSGIKSMDNVLFVFKPTSVSTVIGDINAGVENVQVDALSDSGIGALSHQSIIEVMNRLYFVSQNGVYSITTEGLRPESNDLTPIFTRYRFRENRILSFHWINENKILFLLPEFNGSNEFLNTSQVLVRDIIADAWYIWDNIDFSCGISDDEQQIWFQGKDNVSEMLQNNVTEDYADHELSVTFYYKTHWEAFEDPSIFKKFNRIKTYSLDNELKTFNSASFDLQIETNHDFTDNSVSITNMVFGGASTGWGVAPYGEFPYGSVKVTQLTRRLAALKCKNMRTVFLNSVIHENVLISGFELEVALIYRPGLRGGF